MTAARGFPVWDTTVHRLAKRGSERHRDALFPHGEQVSIMLGQADVGHSRPELNMPAFDMELAINEVADPDNPVRVTLVAVLRSDPNTVEIISGNAIVVEEHYDGQEIIRFEDGDYVYLYDVVGIRLEA